MPNIFNKVKQKFSGSKGHKTDEEQTFSIQPHPAKSNNPAELESPQLGAGLNSNAEMQAHHARDPHIPSQQIMNSLEQPATREQLKARSAELNK
jgi:hypothetical protein